MKKIIIVGGGISGLTAGIYASQQGFQSVIYEKHSVIGGQCTGWMREGCYIDGCIHWLTGTNKKNSLYPIWENIGAIDDSVSIYNPDNFGTFKYRGDSITLWTDLNKLQNEMIQKSPEDKKAIIKMIKQIKIFFKVRIPVSKPFDMMNLSDLFKVAFEFKFILRTMCKMAKIDANEYGKRFQSPLIQYMIKNIIRENYSMKAVMTTVATVASKNGGIPIGGSLNLALRVAKRYQDLGGIIHLNSPVQEIIIERGKAVGIRLENGQAEYADYVVTALDLHFVLNKLLRGQYSMPNYDDKYNDSDKHPSPSNLMIAFKCDYEAKDIPFYTTFTGQEMLVGEKKITDFNLRNFNYDQTRKEIVLASYIFTLDADYEYWCRLYNNKDEYDEAKNRIGQEISKRIITAYPQLEGHIKLIDVWTPATMNSFVNARNGSYMSFIMTARSKMMMSKNVIKDIKNLVFAGQWLMMPGGLPVALLEGKFAIQRICKFEKKKFSLDLSNLSKKRGAEKIAD